MKMDIQTIQTELDQWSLHNFPSRKVHHPLLGATEEMGELCHAHLKMEQGIRGTNEEHIAEAKDAIGDVIIYLMDYCNQMDFDLQTIIEETWQTVCNRDWKKNPKTGYNDEHLSGN